MVVVGSGDIGKGQGWNDYDGSKGSVLVILMGEAIMCNMAWFWRSGDVQWVIIDISLIDCPRVKKRKGGGAEGNVLVGFRHDERHG